ncbi:NADH-quinone oxidoreductase subunit NuoK [Thermosulfuriphilus ammonigenes]|uniref:NADH-quinone oxidoreductase subunit K n=1 Tax=Thermosulfuriphilus ammonigenes TaxID=1936021 RepID=A0A6G7PXK6_9BACT|nr:NADH-quinone oxidoreductase subunit NuoK [Thermosulfuriphilus ammonigenes]MBA2849313.1 NADH-quinone oxidoreductase subunit K [Thermosulfuriphilus ammonigenes]QIJ72392.1 NADH-quinone oxidoreductase subunit NuoK [Thermosulfuriphilus ammonigenes]HFB83386.1 NADH-quinone oxidoreductase subunit NuoK [Thermodesulfatator sp.]
MIPVSWYLTLSLILFALGAFGFLVRRNVIIMLMAIEIMLNAVNISLVALSRGLEDLVGHLLVFFVIAVAAAEAAIGLALVVLLFRRTREIHLDEFRLLKG